MSDVAPEAVPIESRLEAYFGGTPNEPATPAPAPVADGPAVETPSTDDVPEGVDPAAEAVAEQPEGEEPFEELDHLGKVYEVPVSLKKAFEENRAMATKASQLAKSYEPLAAQVAIQAQLLQAEAQFYQHAAPEIQETTKLEAIARQYRDALRSPLEPQVRADYRDQLEQITYQLEDAKGKLTAKRQQFDQWRSQAKQEALAKGQEYLSRVVPNFGADETKQRIAQTALSLGYTHEEVARLEDPRLVVALHKAAQWDRLQASKPATQNRVAKAAPIVRAAGSDSQRTEAQSKHVAARARLKKTGSLDDFAAALLTRMR